MQKSSPGVFPWLTKEPGEAARASRTRAWKPRSAPGTAGGTAWEPTERSSGVALLHVAFRRGALLKAALMERIPTEPWKCTHIEEARAHFPPWVEERCGSCGSGRPALYAGERHVFQVNISRWGWQNSWRKAFEWRYCQSRRFGTNGLSMEKVPSYALWWCCGGRVVPLASSEQAKHR